MTVHVTVSTGPESHWEVDVIRLDGGTEAKVATLKPGESHTAALWAGCELSIREAAEIK